VAADVPADLLTEDLGGLELLPADDEGLAPEEDLAAAVAGALEDLPPEAVEAAPEPFGRTWLWDRQAGRFVRDGISPKEVRGRDALAQWCDAAMHTALGAHPIFDAEFGMEEPEDVIGQAADVDEYASDWAERLRDALQQHDRVTSVENVEVIYDPDAGVVYVTKLDVLTDEEETTQPLQLGGFTIATLEAV
jgi:hypothetical protein